LSFPKPIGLNTLLLELIQKQIRQISESLSKSQSLREMLIGNLAESLIEWIERLFVATLVNGSEVGRFAPITVTARTASRFFPQKIFDPRFTVFSNDSDFQ
jgi:hypothetical protein